MEKFRCNNQYYALFYQVFMYYFCMDVKQKNELHLCIMEVLWEIKLFLKPLNFKGFIG